MQRTGRSWLAVRAVVQGALLAVVVLGEGAAACDDWERCDYKLWVVTALATLLLMVLSCIGTFFVVTRRETRTAHLAAPTHAKSGPSPALNEGPRFDTWMAAGDAKRIALSDVPTQGEPITILSTTELARWRVDRERLSILRELGNGQYGPVFLGKLHTNSATGISRYASTVMVKSISADAPEQQQRNFVYDAHLMMSISHPNILRLIGISFRGHPWYAFFEYTPYGNLLDAVRNAKDHDIPLTEDEQLYFAAQIGAGMTHLSNLGVVHRQLVLRHCLLGDNNVVKISHFKYVRELRDPDEFDRLRSLGKLYDKWLAPEVLRQGASAFSSASDVWSFGIVLHELASHGRAPFRDISSDGLLGSLSSGTRPGKPQRTSDEFFEIMNDCWSYEASERPNFDFVWRLLADLYETTMRNFNKSASDMRDIGRTLVELPDEQGPSTVVQMRNRPPMRIPNEPEYADVRHRSIVFNVPGSSATEDADGYSTVQPRNSLYSRPNRTRTRNPRANPALESPYELPQDYVAPSLPPRNTHRTVQESMVDMITPVRRPALRREQQADHHVWLHEDGSKRAAMQSLEGLGFQDGLFLVRKSKSKPGEYMLVVCFNRDTHNYRIKSTTDASGTRFYVDRDFVFDSLSDLIEYYQTEQGGQRLCHRLTVPCPEISGYVPSTMQSPITPYQ
eukprot:m.286159 g.286159  ORF g.286159 m.286159 type:complete len:677 (+) comp11527_c0_seq1:106-2136(+)